MWPGNPRTTRRILAKEGVSESIQEVAIPGPGQIVQERAGGERAEIAGDPVKPQQLPSRHSEVKSVVLQHTQETEEQQKPVFGREQHQGWRSQNLGRPREMDQESVEVQIGQRNCGYQRNDEGAESRKNREQQTQERYC